MSIQAIVWVIERSQSTLSARLVALSIANHADRLGRNSFPSVRTIAHEARISETEVRNSVKDLIALGELEITKQGGGRFSNTYSLCKMVGDAVRFVDTDVEDTPAESAGVYSRIGTPPRQSPPHSVASPPHSTSKNGDVSLMNRPESMNRPISIGIEALPKLRDSFYGVWRGAAKRGFNKGKDLTAKLDALLLRYGGEAVEEAARRYAAEQKKGFCSQHPGLAMTAFLNSECDEIVSSMWQEEKNRLNPSSENLPPTNSSVAQALARMKKRDDSLKSLEEM